MSKPGEAEAVAGTLNKWLLRLASIAGAIITIGVLVNAAGDYQDKKAIILIEKTIAPLKADAIKTLEAHELFIKLMLQDSALARKYDSFVRKEACMEARLNGDQCVGRFTP